MMAVIWLILSVAVVILAMTSIVMGLNLQRALDENRSQFYSLVAEMERLQRLLTPVICDQCGMAVVDPLSMKSREAADVNDVHSGRPHAD
jgi:hypothetical protein